MKGRKMKKIILLVLPLAFISLIFAGCSLFRSKENKPREIVISKILEVSGDSIFDKEKDFLIKYKASKVPKKLEKDNRYISAYYMTENGNYIRIGNSKVDSKKNEVSFETVFPGNYVVLCRKEPFGITVEGKIDSGEYPFLLIQGPLLGNQTWDKLIKELKMEYPQRAILIYEYPQNASLRSVTRLLSDDLEKLHNKYGDFRVNVITHSFGSQVLVGYIGKDYYQDDVSSILYLSPTLNGETSASEYERENFLSDLRFEAGDPGLAAEILAPWLAGGDKVEYLIPEDDYYENLYEKYEDKTRSMQNGGNAEYNIEIEALSGNKIPDIYQPPEKRISVLSRRPYDIYNHNITKDNRVIKKVIEFYKLPEPYSTAYITDRKQEDIYKESIYEISVHEWRDYDTLYLYQLGKNLLSAIEENGILFTNGDMDSYYPWDLQNRENYRTDVDVVNLSLLNTSWYIKMFKDKEGFIFNLPESQILNSQDSVNSALYPRRLPRETTVNIKGNDVVDDFEIIFPKGEVLYTNDLAVIQILKDNYGKRPIYFAVTCVHQDGLDNHLQNEGLTDKVVSTSGHSQIDFDKLIYNLNNVYEFDGIEENYEKIDSDVRRLFQNYGAAFLRVSQKYIKEEDYELAASYYEKALTFIIDKERFYPKLIELYSEIVEDELDESSIDQEKIQRIISRLDEIKKKELSSEDIERIDDMIDKIRIRE